MKFLVFLSLLFQINTLFAKNRESSLATLAKFYESLSSDPLLEKIEEEERRIFKLLESGLVTEDEINLGKISNLYGQFKDRYKLKLLELESHYYSSFPREINGEIPHHLFDLTKNIERIFEISRKEKSFYESYLWKMKNFIEIKFVQYCV